MCDTRLKSYARMMMYLMKNEYTFKKWFKSNLAKYNDIITKIPRSV